MTEYQQWIADKFLDELARPSWRPMIRSVIRAVLRGIWSAVTPLRSCLGPSGARRLR